MEIAVNLVCSFIGSLAGVLVGVASSVLGFLLGMLSCILEFVPGMAGSVIDVSSKSTGVVSSCTAGVFDPDVIVEGSGVTEPGDVRQSQVTGKLVNLEEVVSNSDGGGLRVN